MRYLIDGYNLMFSGGLVGKKLGPERFRKVRTRFLNDLAATLGPVVAHQTTVVFDAAAPPDDFPRSTSFKGLTVVYAVDDENADERIELLIARDSSPKGLTVVSSDRRIRQAATRRQAVSVTADEFWVTLDALKEGPKQRPRPSPEKADRPSDVEVSPAESAYWLRQFGDLDNQPETRKALNNDMPMLTDEEIARLEREIEQESD